MMAVAVVVVASLCLAVCSWLPACLFLSLLVCERVCVID